MNMWAAQPVYDLASLFEQLGLDSDEAAMNQFIKTHRIPEGVKIYEADFWNASQADFIKESLLADAKWAIVIEELNVRLHEDA